MRKLFLILFLYPLIIASQSAIQKNLNSTFPGFILQVHDATICNDGNFIISASLVDSIDFSYKNSIIKFDSQFQVQWQLTIDEDTLDFVAADIGQLPNGDYYISGQYWDQFTSNYGLYIMNLSPAGSINWTKSIDSQLTYLYLNPSINADANSNIYFSGTAENSLGNSAMVAIKLDSQGNVVWANSYASGDFKNPSLNHAATMDGGVIISGKSGSNIYLVKVDMNGNVQWVKDYFDGNYTRAYAITQLTDGSYLVGGYCSGMDFYPFILKLDQSGNFMWRKRYNFDGDAFSELLQLFPLSNGELMALVTCNSEHVFSKFNANGDVLNAFFIDSFNPLNSSSTSELKSVNGDNPYILGYMANQQTSEIPFILMQSDGLGFNWCDKNQVVSTTEFEVWTPSVSNQVFQEIFTLPFTSLSILPASTNFVLNFSNYCSNTNVEEKFTDLFSLSPNPATTHLNIDLGANFVEGMSYQIVDVLGKVHASGPVNQSTSQLDIQSLPSGFYFLEIMSGDKSFSQKFIKE